MNKTNVTMKFRKSTRDTLRMIAALTGKTMAEIADKLATQELKKVQDGKKNVHTSV